MCGSAHLKTADKGDRTFDIANTKAKLALAYTNETIIEKT